MATIATIAVSVQARTEKLTSGLRKASTEVKGFNSKLSRLKGPALALGAAVGIASAALAVFVIRTAKAIDETAKLAFNLGISIAALDAYELGAKLAGVSQQGLNTALRRLQKNISDATLGLTTAIRAFDGLGLSAEALKEATPEEQFEIVAEAFKGVKNQSDRTRIALDLFGRSGLGLLKFFEGGRVGLREMRKEVDKLGGSLTAAEAKGVEDFNDSVVRLRFFLKLLLQQLTARIAPTLQKFVELVTNNADVIKDFATSGIRNLVVELKNLLSFVKLLISPLLLFLKVLTGIANAAATVKEAFRTIVGGGVFEVRPQGRVRIPIPMGARADTSKKQLTEAEKQTTLLGMIAAATGVPAEEIVVNF